MRKKKIVKISIFTFILLIGWIGVRSVLQLHKDPAWNIRGMEKVRNSPNYYDVLISGTSMSITNVSAEELYLKYGIASVSIGEPEQLAFLSYYSLEEALKYQNPKVVLFDVQALLYSEDRQETLLSNEDYAAHYTLDSITGMKTKYDAVTQIKKYKSSSTYWDYFSKMYHYHGNWENITKNNFKLVQGKELMLESKNLLGMYESNPDKEYVSEKDNLNEKIEITEENRRYVEKIAALCKKKGVELILIRSYGSYYWSWQEYNTIKEIADELDVDYLDLALYEEQIGFQWATDTHDRVHHNVVGTKKWTDYLGKYLCSKYKFADRRLEKEYIEYENQKEKYDDIVKVMEQKIALIKAVNLNQYLDTLLNLEKEENTIFISVCDEASNKLSDNSQNILNSIGFNVNLKDQYGISYYGVMDDGKIIAENSSQNGGHINGKLNDNTEFQISSGGSNSEQSASIIISGQEYVQGGRGLNIVVYNKKNKEILSSVFFDTYSEENPNTARINSSGIIEKEELINYWVS